MRNLGRHVVIGIGIWLALAGCGGTSSKGPDGAASDAKPSGPKDAATGDGKDSVDDAKPAQDTAADVSVDVDDASVDASSTASDAADGNAPERPADASADAGNDSGTQDRPPVDASADAGNDGGTQDRAPVDAAPDAGNEGGAQDRAPADAGPEVRADAQDAGSSEAAAGDALLDGGAPDQAAAGERRLLVEAIGVGLSSTAGRSVLERAVKVLAVGAATPLPWAAMSDKPWLSVTASGMTGGALTLKANAAGLAAESVHYATVTVTSPDAGVANSETIRVGLFVTAATPASVSVTDSVASTIVASPVEPVVFVCAAGTDVKVYNVFTGALERTLANVAAQCFTMVTSGDGRRLYVFDRTNLRVQEVDAATGAAMRTFSSASDMPVYGGMAVTRPSAHAALIVPSGKIYDLASGDAFPDTSIGHAISLHPSPDSSLVVTESGTALALAWISQPVAKVTATYTFSTGTTAGREGQACFRADGAMIYTASGGRYEFPGYDVRTRTVGQILPGFAYPDAVQCVWNGLFIGGIDGYYEAADIFVYDAPSGIQRAKLSSATATGYRSLVSRGLAASADGSRLVSISSMAITMPGSVELRFQSLPAPL